MSAAAPSRAQSFWTDRTVRGAPFVGFIVLLAVVGLVFAAQIPFENTLLVLLIAYAVAGSQWSVHLARTRWRDTKAASTVPETIAALVSIALALTGLVFAQQGDAVIPWVTFAVQVVIVVVMTPITMRKFPGLR
jgi:hypothetical protein